MHGCVNRYGIVSCAECVSMPIVTVYEIKSGDARLGMLFIEDDDVTWQPQSDPRPVSYSRQQAATILWQHHNTVGHSVRRVQ